MIPSCKEQEKESMTKIMMIGLIDSTILQNQCLQHQSMDKKKYIFCWTSFDADNVTRMATDLEDTALLTRIDSGDLTALEAKYHLSCLTSYTLRNRHRSFLRQSESFSNDGEEGRIEARAFVELVTHVENSIENGTFCFKLSVLCQI